MTIINVITTLLYNDYSLYCELKHFQVSSMSAIFVMYPMNFHQNHFAVLQRIK